MDKILLPTTNADGLPIIPMNEEQKYIFDLKGWITLPGLLDEEQLDTIREHQMKFLYEPIHCHQKSKTITVAPLKYC